jgi:sigma-B regulation protein RsbU (phosphoserine phosphatase)
LALAFNDMSEQMQTLMRQQAEHESVERELAIARSVQQRLFPERLPELPYLEANGICLPARMVSGDYYDFIPVPGGCDALIADVSGKGMSAALLMASVHAALRSQYPGNGGAPPDPGEILTRLNRHLHESLEASRFVTLLLVRVLEGGELVYGNAGHNPALLLRGDRIEWLRAGGFLLGPFADSRFESTSLAVRQGDVLCLYTDGVTEAVGPEGEQFGEQRLAETLRHAGDLEPRALQEHIVESVRDWQGGAEAGDDLTLVVLRFTGR